MRKFAHNQRTDRQRRNSNTETTLSLSSVDTRGSWPICLGNLLYNGTVTAVRITPHTELGKGYCIVLQGDV